MFEFSVFPCPARLLWDGSDISLRPQERVILLRLVCAKDLTVPGTVLVQALWHGDPTSAAAGTLRTHIAHIRHAVRAVAGDKAASTLFATLRISGGAAAYKLGIDPDRIDVRRWEMRLQAARDQMLWTPARESEAAVGRVLAGWTADPLRDATGWQFARDERKRLGDLRRNGRLQLVDYRIAAGRDRDVVADLAELTAECPGEHGIWTRLVSSLWRSRQDQAAAKACRDALDAFRALGLDTADLDKLQHAVLHGWLPR